MGNLKGVKHVLRNPQPKWEIYDLSNDPSETIDISEKYPELASKFDEIVNKRTPSHHEPWNFMTSNPLIVTHTFIVSVENQKNNQLVESSITFTVK